MLLNMNQESTVAVILSRVYLINWDKFRFIRVNVYFYASNKKVLINKEHNKILSYIDLKFHFSSYERYSTSLKF